MTNTEQIDVVAEARELAAEAQRNGIPDYKRIEIALRYVKRSPELTTKLCDEVERLRGLMERAQTCVVCSATLLEPETPPHCQDCILTEGHYER